MQQIEEPVPTTGYERIKLYCLKHALPSEVWNIAYDPDVLAQWKRDYPANSYSGPGPFPSFPKLPVNIGQIDFPRLIERLGDELCEISDFFKLHASEEQALQCVKLVRWLLENGRL